MKLLAGPLTQRITEVLRRHGVVSDWQQGCSSASWPCPCGRAGGAGYGKLCAARRSGLVSYGFCWRCSRGCPREGEELVQVPMDLRGGWVVDCQPLSHHASRVGGLDAAL